jgi:hypothetical protein
MNSAFEGRTVETPRMQQGLVGLWDRGNYSASAELNSSPRGNNALLRSIPSMVGGQRVAYRGPVSIQSSGKGYESGADDLEGEENGETAGASEGLSFSTPGSRDA